MNHVTNGVSVSVLEQRPNVEGGQRENQTTNHERVTLKDTQMATNEQDHKMNDQGSA